MDRKTANSKLQEVVLKEADSTVVDNPREVVAESRHISTYIVDLMAAVVQIPENYEELTWKLLSSFPKRFQRVDIVADTYRNVSSKAGEREIRGRSDKVVIKLAKSKVPKDFQSFLRNSVKKNRLIDLLCDTISSSSDRALAILQTSVIYFSKEDSCVRVNASQVTTVDELSSNQEEANAKVHHTLRFNYFTVLLWSHWHHDNSDRPHCHQHNRRFNYFTVLLWSH